MHLEDLDPIVVHSARRAATAAISLWALSTAQYPMVSPRMLDEVEAAVIETATTFAVNARRAMQAQPDSVRYVLTPRSVIEGQTEPYARAAERSAEPVTDLRYALNRIVHATRLEVPFWVVPAEASRIDEAAVMITTVLIETDDWPLSYIDPFSIASGYLRGPWIDFGGSDEIH